MTALYSKIGAWRGRIVVVTGGTSGIGRAFVVRLAAEGARVIACARNETALRELKARYPAIEVFRCEITARLLETATKYEVHKYIAVAHKLMAQIAIAEGDKNKAEAEFETALGELGNHRVPVLAWRIYAELARLKTSDGDAVAAREAYSNAAEIVKHIASQVNDEPLRERFLSSAAVQEVVTGATG